MEPKFKILGKNEQGARIRIEQKNKLLTFREVFNYWQTSTNFIEFYIDSLIALNYDEFFWEHPALKEEYLDKSYEFIVQKSISFSKRNVDENAFSNYINSDKQVAVFDNLGRNAKLIVPTKKIPIDTYKHMGNFIRNAEKIQIIEQFNQLSKAILSEVGAGRLIWVSTAGLGVIWLHMRLDSRPKYYRTNSYKRADFLEG
ncbi:MAG: hypothetical protein ACI94Y_001153 [Maribacter sp.]|jgi:hypothetical protein